MPNPAIAQRFTLVQQWMNLLAILKYGIVFSVLFVFLPLTARDGVPLHGLLGGLFVDLTAGESSSSQSHCSGRRGR